MTEQNGLRTFRAIPKGDGTVQYEELTDTWKPVAVLPGQSMASDAEVASAILAHSELPDAHHPQAHSHATHGDINFIGTVSADGDQGITGSKTIGGFRITFKKGLLTGFDPV